MRNFIQGIKNLINWLPTIWNDRQWDHSYIEILMSKKLQIMIDFYSKINSFEGVENEIKWMKKCKCLLDNLINSTYWEDKYDIMPSFNGLQDDKKAQKFYTKMATVTNGIGHDLWEWKARRLVWKIIAWRYTYWWD